MDAKVCLFVSVLFGFAWFFCLFVFIRVLDFTGHGSRGDSKESGKPTFFHRLVKLCVPETHWAPMQSLELWVARVMYQGELGFRQRPLPSSVAPASRVQHPASVKLSLRFTLTLLCFFLSGLH